MVRDFIPSITQLDKIEAAAVRLAKIAADGASKPAPKTKAKAPTQRGRRAIGIIKAHFSQAHAKGIGKLMAIALNDPAIEAEIDSKAANEARDIPGFFTSSEWARGAAIIATGNRSSHNYPIGKVSIMAGENDRMGWRLINGKFDSGNHMDSSSDSWRPATVAEIKSAFAEMRKYIGEKQESDTGLPD